MKRLIVLSWGCILVGGILAILPILGQENFAMLVYALGNVLIILPNFIWIMASNKLASAALNKRPSLIVTLLSIIAPIAAFVSFGLLSSIMLLPDGASTGLFSSSVLEGLMTVSFLTIFVALITSSILVSGRIIDTEDSPKAGRVSRIFVLCICFFYILIGMFFIAPKLKKLKNRAL